MNLPAETFAALSAEPAFRHAFLCRAPGLDVNAEREQALARLVRVHEEALRALGFGEAPPATAKQVHGNMVVVAGEPGPPAQADGLVTNRPGLCLGVYVADCCAIYLADPRKRAIGLLHSGRKGTELEIARRGVEKMTAEFGSDPADIVAQLSPCIRPPFYEVDFAAEIARQLREAGVGSVSDCGANTGADLERYYSYRMEKGRTGRMLAVLIIEPGR